MAGGTPGLMMSGWKNTVTHIAHWCVWLEHGGGSQFSVSWHVAGRTLGLMMGHIWVVS